MRPTLEWPKEWLAQLSGLNLLSSLLARRPAQASEWWVGELVSLSLSQLGTRSAPDRGENGDLFRAGLLYAADDLEGAHAVFQQLDSPEGAYWHGMLHRREGDFPNARYWVRRAGTVGALAGLDAFSPIDFIGKCEAAAKIRADPLDLLDLQMREWEAMIHWSWLRLHGDTRGTLLVDRGLRDG
jgi:hypothetical protein